MRYTPPNQKKEVSVAVFACFAVAAVMYIFSLTGLTWRWPLQLIMALCLCAGAYILVRYRFTSVTYGLRKRERHSSASFGDDISILPPSMVDFAVHRAQGQRENMEFILSLDKLREAVKVESGTVEKLRSRYKALKVYYYTVDFVKRERIAAVFEDGGEVYCAVIESEPSFSEFLFDVCRRNKENGEIQ